MILEQVAIVPEMSAMINEHVKTISNECGDFLKSADGSLLFRGVKGLSPNEVHYHTPRKERAPVDSSIELTDLLNTHLKDLAGFKPRTDAVFTTGSAGVASNYGTAFIVYPKDGFKFIWSPEIRDAYGFFTLGVGRQSTDDKWQQVYDTIPDYEDRMARATGDEYDELDFETTSKFLEMFAKDLYKTGENSTIKEAAASDAEIMLDCEGFYLVPYSNMIGRGVRAGLDTWLENNNPDTGED